LPRLAWPSESFLLVWLAITQFPAAPTTDAQRWTAHRQDEWLGGPRTERSLAPPVLPWHARPS
jgi:hypothetical protein